MLEKKIIKFIAKHHLLTLATVSEDGAPHCSNIFYSYSQERNCFIFATDIQTQHGAQMVERKEVAAAIALETKVVGRLQGLQIAGVVEQTNSKEDREIYLDKYPYAVAMPLTLWRLEPQRMKLTDNTLGFGKKLIWERE